MAIRITYDSKTIDLLIGPQGLNHVPPKQERNQNRSGSGKIETINFFGIQELELDVYFTEAIFRDLWAWWSWARQGKVWAFALDSDAGAATTLDAAAASGQKVVPLTATAGFAADGVCLLRADDSDDEFEIVVIDSVSAGDSITAVENLKYSYASGDIFRHWDYWPEVISLDTEFDPKKSGAYYSHTFRFAESL